MVFTASILFFPLCLPKDGFRVYVLLRWSENSPSNNIFYKDWMNGTSFSVGGGSVLKTLAAIKKLFWKTLPCCLNKSVTSIPHLTLLWTKNKSHIWFSWNYWSQWQIKRTSLFAQMFNKIVLLKGSAPTEMVWMIKISQL